MPTCRKCESKFYNWLLYDGKRRNISKRKYCLKCSPFDKHNTSKLHMPQKGDLLVCKKCSKEYVYNRRGETKSICLSCVQKTHFRKKKAWAVNYLGGKCCVCGYSKCLRALSFHHKDPSQKDFTISSSYCLSYKRIQTELDKCVLICSNHHHEVHAGMIVL